MFAFGCRGFEEVEMKTSEDVRESGDLVDSVISWKEMSHGDVSNYLERGAA